MGFAMHKGVELSWGEVYIMRFVGYKGVLEARISYCLSAKHLEEGGST